MKKVHLLFIAITLIAFILRFFQLGSNPPSLTWDEVAWGYNAYSLSRDGKDEFGRLLPIDYFESFGDFKPPVYAYLTVIPVMFFGMNEFATRFASAFFGVLTVLVTYFLVKQIFYVSKNVKIYALLSMLFLAISPWHINLSRAAFEANVATFFLVCGIWLFFFAINKNPYLLSVSSVSFVLSLYTFNSARAFAPLIILVLVLVFGKKLFVRKHFVFAGIVGLLLLLPILPFLFSPQAGLRFKEVNIFSDPTIVEKSNRQVENDGNAFWSKIIHNRRVGYSVSYLKHYFDNVSPSFLFLKGDGNPKFSTQDVGQMYLWDLPFFVIGILYLFRRKEGHWWIIPVWIILGIAPSATARETPHALRIETTLPTFQIITAYGLIALFTKISNFKFQISNLKIKYLLFALTFLFLLFNFFYYIHGYYMHYPREYSGEWQYGYKESIDFVRNVKDDYDKIYVTSELGRPYIYYLFYMQYDPQRFQETMKVIREAYGFVTVEGFDTFAFAKQLQTKPGNILYINTPSNVPQNAQVLKEFYLLNGEKALAAYTL